jgi:hypothetical protein
MTTYYTPKSARGKATVQLVYIEWGTEHDDEGGELRAHPSEEVLERTKDDELIRASVRAENRRTQGIVCAYLGDDRHWHLDHVLSADECEGFAL